MRYTLIMLFLLLPLITEAQRSVDVHSDLFSKKRDVSIKINGERAVKTPATINFELNRSYNIELADPSNSPVSDFEFKILKFSDKSNSQSPSWYRSPNSVRSKYSGYSQLFSSHGKSRSMEISYNKGLDEAKKKAGVNDEKKAQLKLLTMEVHEIEDYYEVYLLWGK
jgi:hypothetical protein